MKLQDNKLAEYLLIQNLKDLNEKLNNEEFDFLDNLNYFFRHLDSLYFFDYAPSVSFYVAKVEKKLRNEMKKFDSEEIDFSVFLFLRKQAGVCAALLNKLNNKKITDSFLLKTFVDYDSNSDLPFLIDFLRVSYSFYLSEKFVSDFLVFWKKNPDRFFKDVFPVFISKYSNG